MSRLVAACLLALSTVASAQPVGAPTPQPPAGERPAESPAVPPPATDREQVKRELLEDVQRVLEKQKEELRDEVRAQLATQAATRTLEEEFPFHEERKRLELFEIDGYFRMRPTLSHGLDLGRPADPGGHALFPRPAIGADARTLASADVRWRLEPTLNVSEDVRLRAQIDALDNLVLGSTPDRSLRDPLVVGSTAQVSPGNGLSLRRVFGDVTTPVGQFLFGRMGSQWGTGMLTHSGNCEDCDFGDTVDRVMFVSTRFAGHHLVPFLDFLSEGAVESRGRFGEPVDLEQLDDARAYGVAVARRDTEVELRRKLAAGQEVLNYGVYFVYRTQRFDAPALAAGTAPTGADFVPRDASAYLPDLWARFQTPRLRLEAEVAGVFGTVGSAAATPGLSPDENRSLTLQQFGAVFQGEYEVIDDLRLALDLGFASGDRAPGMGNLPGRASPYTAGVIDGPQYCLSAGCQTTDDRVTNFRFNRDYRVDLILWREIFQGVTDAIYVKPGLRYEVTEGLTLWGNVIYSRAAVAESTPYAHLDDAGNLVTDPNLGVEIDLGARYESGDGFATGFSYGVLFPLRGLAHVTGGDAKTAQAVRGWFVINY